jgi:hypothetical protein
MHKWLSFLSPQPDSLHIHPSSLFPSYYFRLILFIDLETTSSISCHQSQKPIPPHLNTPKDTVGNENKGFLILVCYICYIFAKCNETRVYFVSNIYMLLFVLLLRFSLVSFFNLLMYHVFMYLLFNSMWHKHSQRLFHKIAVELQLRN